MVVRELVTVLSYRHDKMGMNAYENSLNAMPRSVRDATRRSESVLSRFSNRASKLLQMSLKIHGINQAKSELESVGSSIKGIGGTLKALTAGYLGIQGIKQFSSFISNAAGEYEVGMMRLNTLVGEQKAGGVLNQLRDMAAKTPYELPEILDLFTSLQGSGYELMDRKSGKLYLDRMTAIGDASAIAGKPLSEMKDMILGLGKGLPNMFDNFSGAGFAGAKVEGDSIVGDLVNARTGKSRKFTLNPDDKKAILDLIVGQGKAEGVSGGMEKLAGTLPGMLSTAADTIKGFGVEIWEGGLKYPVKSIMTDMQEWANKTMPDLGKSFGRFLDAEAERFSVWAYKVVDFLKEAKPLVKPVGIGLGLIASYLIGAKVLAGYAVLSVGLGKMLLFAKTILPLIPGIITFVRTAGLASTLMAGLSVGVAALLPVLIGGAIAALAYLGYKLYEYWTKGDAALDGLRERFPGLADGIARMGDLLRELWPEFQILAGYLKDGLIWGVQTLGNAFMWTFENIAIPLLTLTLKIVNDLIEGLGIMYDWAGPKISIAFEFWSDVVSTLHQNFINFFNYLYEKFPWLKSIVDAISNGVAGMFGGSGSSGGSDDVNNVNSGGAKRLIASTSKISTLPGYCYEAVYKGIVGAFGQNNAIAKAGANYWKHAYLAKGPLSRSKDFREVKLTRDKLKDKDFMASISGGIAVYQRDSGQFSSRSGHIEVLDTINNKSFYGRGAVNRDLSQLSDKALASMSYFVPVSNGGQTVSVPPSYVGQGPGKNANVTIKQDFHGQTDPKKAGQAATDGTTKALHKAGMNTTKQAVCK